MSKVEWVFTARDPDDLEQQRFRRKVRRLRDGGIDYEVWDDGLLARTPISTWIMDIVLVLATLSWVALVVIVLVMAIW